MITRPSWQQGCQAALALPRMAREWGNHVVCITSVFFSFPLKFFKVQKENVTRNDNSVWNNYFFSAVFSNCWFVWILIWEFAFSQCGWDTAQRLSRSHCMQIAKSQANSRVFKKKERKRLKTSWHFLCFYLQPFKKTAPKKKVKQLSSVYWVQSL